MPYHPAGTRERWFAWNVPAQNCGREGPAKREDALSPGRRLRTLVRMKCACSKIVVRRTAKARTVYRKGCSGTRI